MSNQWYIEYYRDYGDNYDGEPYTKNTIKEVDFIESEIDYDRNRKILDVGCGSGRHSIELARRGYNVVGIDLSKSMLDKARSISHEENLNVKFIQTDARKLDYHKQFDLVLSICEGAFSLMETDEMDYLILEKIFKSLKNKGKFILSAPNAVYALTHKIDGEFNIITFRERFKLKKRDRRGLIRIFDCNQRYYTCTELNFLLESLGFKKIRFCGFKNKIFERDEKPSKDDYEILVLSEK